MVLGAAVVLRLGGLGFSGLATAQDAGTGATSTAQDRINPHLPADSYAAQHVVDGTPAGKLPRAGALARNAPPLTAVLTWLSAPTTVERDGARTALGPAAEHMANLEAEYEREGWRQVGTPKIVGSPVGAPVEIDGRQGLRVTVCLNDASVRVMGANGRVVRPESQGQRVLNTFDLVETPGTGWQVVATGFPSDPRC